MMKRVFSFRIRLLDGLTVGDFDHGDFNWQRRCREPQRLRDRTIAESCGHGALRLAFTKNVLVKTRQVVLRFQALGTWAFQDR